MWQPQHIKHLYLNSKHFRHIMWPSSENSNTMLILEITFEQEYAAFTQND